MNLKCYNCKREFPREQMTFYQSAFAKTGRYYCPDCIGDRKSRDSFARTVCEIFGLKSPGPRIQTERQRIQHLYGYDDKTITDCLNYLYRVKGQHFWSESIYRVTPETVEEMKKYQDRKEREAQKIAAAAATNLQVKTTNTRAQPENHKQYFDPDDWIEG